MKVAARLFRSRACQQTPGSTEGLGLGNDWAYNVIDQLGNYDEIFERNIGTGSPLKIARGMNALWARNGIQYAPPIR